MTREEAINVLNAYDVNFYEYTAEEIVDAIDMATEALKAEPTGDLISREAAIEAIASHDTTNGNTVYFKGKTVIGYIKDLPSAEPVHGEWIPVGEGLPSESGGYICTIPLKPLFTGETYVDVLTFHKGRFYEDGSELGKTYYDDVIAWMPLPKPYDGAKMLTKESPETLSLKADGEAVSKGGE